MKLENDVRIFLLLLSFLCIPSYAFAGDDEEELVVEYLAVSPKFMINLAEPKKYMRVDIQLMIEGEKPIEKVKKHLPAIRHALIMTFSGRSAEGLQTMKEREQLRVDALKVVEETLDKQAKNSDGLRDLFFTEFLVQ